MKRRKEEIDKIVDVHLGLFELPPAEDMARCRERTLERLRSGAVVTAKQRVEESGSRYSGRKWQLLVAAASVLLAALVATTLVRQQSDSLADVKVGETIRTSETGEMFAFPDGSRVEMRSKSEAVLERTVDGLKVRLNKGGVIVNAAKQMAGRHLYVQTKDVNVTVVGTVFLVNAENEGSRVAVIEGQVRVQQGETEEKLGPGEQATSNPLMHRQSVGEEIAWSRHAETHLAMLQQATVSKPPEPAPAQADLNFEVASVRRVDIATTAIGGVPVFAPTGGVGSSDPRRITYHGAWLSNLIAEAFGIRANQITGPEWLSKERYDVIANIPEGATTEQFNVMLGNLLRDRFHLRFHIDTKISSVYALRVAKDGPKFKETALHHDENGTAPPSGVGWTTDAKGFPVPPPDRHGMVGIPGNGEMRLTAQDVPIRDFALSLESRAGRPVIDETGLTGYYDFKIHYENFRRPAVVADPAPTIFDALEQQLGLKLESSTSPIAHFTIDSIDREPTDN